MKQTGSLSTDTSRVWFRKWRVLRALGRGDTTLPCSPPPGLHVPSAEGHPARIDDLPMRSISGGPMERNADRR